MTKTRDLSDFLIEGGADLPLGKPHIVPGVLQPAVAGKLLNGANHSGAYGTAQTQSGGDGHKYYYTDIKGSKPIKDPRIGAHFGSQRHKFKSIQLLEQETATHGKNVHSVDGRENIRVVGEHYKTHNTASGNNLILFRTNYSDNNGHFLEVTGYFSDANFIQMTYTDVADGSDVYIDGALVESNRTARTSAATPLGGRYVDTGSVFRAFDTSQTLGIHTLKYTWVNSAGTTNAYQYLYGIELIAQDTTSTANKSKIQIPSQDVVSRGKKFTVSGTPHYDPFTTMSYGGSGTTLSALQSLIDTDTSLGMDAWKAGTSNYHRPWNGGRVIKWVDSSGTIKTSVNMMSPNAQNIETTASNAVSDAHVIAGTNDDTINFNTSAIDHSLAEVAKTFHCREFGNGSANAGTGGTYADASMLSATEDDISYVMDDGLTSLTGNDVHEKSTSGRPVGIGINTTNATGYIYITFIGTGITFETEPYGTAGGRATIAQNLPYGTHVLKVVRDDDSDPDYTIDGVALNDVDLNTFGAFTEVTFHQPKKPPIPEDACVIADYMLMADFVPITSQNSNMICKGVRRQNSSRDIFYDETDGDSFSFHTSTQPEGFGVEIDGNGADTATAFKARIPSFGTNIVHRGYASVSRAQIYVDSTSQTTTDDSTTNNYGSYQYIATSKTLGVYNWGANAVAGTNGNITSFEIVTPIHTSSHYQPFETPFLHELVGGDRNMEQHNLVCSPDGKTWDEVTRDVSYIGSSVLSATETDTVTGGAMISFTDRRGKVNTHKNLYNKDFAIAYDRDICLKDGFYELSVFTNAHTDNSNQNHAEVYKNGVLIVVGEATTSGKSMTSYSFHLDLKRGDYIQIAGRWTGSSVENGYYIKRL